MRSNGLTLGLVIAVAGCSSNQETNPAQCGTGTVLVGDRCEAVDSGIGGAAGGSGASGAGGGGGGDGGGSAGEGGAGGSAVDSGTDVGVDAPTSACPTGLPGPALVEVSTPNGDRYCIDATEVTVAHYAAFAKAKETGYTGKYDMSGQPPGCETNETYVADPQECATSGDNYPVGCVDWCDSYKYCEWAGKRLCGTIGGGHLAEGDYADTNKAEWFNACTGGGKYDYTYGDTYQPTTCATQDWPGDTPIEVGAATGCHGAEPPFSSVYDMSGNQMEWIDACAGTHCQVMDVGGSYVLPEDHKCAYLTTPGYRLGLFKGVGIRCCADTQ